MNIGTILYHPLYGKITLIRKAFSPVKNAVVWYGIDTQGVERPLDGTETTNEPSEPKDPFSSIATIKGAKGDKGNVGPAGLTPRMGVDYYSKGQVDKIVNELISAGLPIKGKDYFTQKEIDSFLEKATPIKGKDYFDGKNGKTPKYGVDYFTADDISNVVKKVLKEVKKVIKDGEDGKSVEFKWEGTKLFVRTEGEKWGEGVELQGLPGLGGMGGGIHKIDDATDVNIKNPTEGQALVYNATTKKWEPGTVAGGSSAFTDLTDVPTTYVGQSGKAAVVNGTEDGLVFSTISGTDEKVKFDASDTVAGYVADKLVAGAGISVSEGSGATENKLVITNSNPTAYSLPTASSSVLGGIKVGTTLGIVAGVLDYTNPNPTPYTLPTASSSVLGGIKIGDRLSINTGVLSADVQTTDISGKVDKVTGSSLVADTEIAKIHASGSDNQDLSGYELLSNKQTDLTASATKYPTVNAVNTGLGTKQATMGADDNYVTDAEKVVIGNTSGTNSGNQDLSGLVTKATYDAHTILYATTDDTPVALTVGASTFVGRKASGNISAMSVTEATALLNVFVPDTGAGGVKGLAPATASGDNIKFLKGDGTWGTPAGTGDFKADGTVPMTGGLVLAAGTTTVQPIKMVAGTNLTVAVAGVFEYDGTSLFFTIA